MTENKAQSRHGMNALMTRVKVRGLAAIDHRTTAARDLMRWKKELLADLGGQENVSTQRLAIVDLTVRTKLYIDHVDAFLMEQKSLVNRRRKALLPIVTQRQTLCDSLARLLNQLGLERIPKPVPPLDEYIGKTDSTP
jgi:hypothetical protein